MVSILARPNHNAFLQQLVSQFSLASLYESFITDQSHYADYLIPYLKEFLG